MALELFLMVPGIPGDSTRVGFERQIVLQSFTWGVTGGLDSPTLFQPLIVTKNLDTATPQLEQAVISRRFFPTVTLSAVRVAEEIQTLVRYVFSDAVFTEFSESAVAGGTIDERLTMQYDDVQITVNP